jgi:hypothetical protein
MYQRGVRGLDPSKERRVHPHPPKSSVSSAQDEVADEFAPRKSVRDIFSPFAGFFFVVIFAAVVRPKVVLFSDQACTLLSLIIRIISLSTVFFHPTPTANGEEHKLQFFPMIIHRWPGLTTVELWRFALPLRQCRCIDSARSSTPKSSAVAGSQTLPLID